MLDRGRDEHQPTISFPVCEGIIGHRTHINDIWGGKPPKSYNKKSHHNSWNELGVLQLGTESSRLVVEDDESGICSPPLWTTSPPRSPHHRKNHYRCLSPASKTQAIARGQRELMEIVRSMPESSYELSLKDLVEHPQRVDVVGEEKKRVGERNLRNKNGHKREGGTSITSSRKVVDKRSGKNIDSGGFYLKMVFPISFGSNKNNNKNKKKDESLGNNSSSKSKVSPRTSSVSDGSAKGLDKEWWKKKSFSGSRAESDSGVSSINSGSMKSSGSSSSTNSSRSNSRHEMSASSCWPFIRRPESLSHK